MDMAISYKRLLNLEEEPLEALGGCAALDSAAMEALISWTGRPIGDVRMVFRGEVFVSRGLRNPTMRGCPVCLREDAEAYDGSPLEAMMMRGDWQFREVVICLRHHHPLVPLWTVANPSDRNEIGARLNEIIPDLLAGRLDREQLAPTPYDFWLDGRLENGRDTTWFAQHDLYPAASFCRILGQELLRFASRADADTNSLDRSAHERGFEVASKGEASIIAALNEHIQFAMSRNLEIGGALGDLFYRRESKASFDLECFATFRRLLHAFVVENWPFEKAELVYGTPFPERILHSIGTASKQVGIEPDLLRQLLEEIGAVDAKDDRPNAWVTFPAKDHALFLSELPTWRGRRDFRQAMGASLREFKALVEDQVLSPRTRLPNVRKPWRLSDGLELVADLKAAASPVNAEDDSWEKLQDAKTRSGISVGLLIAAIRSGDLQVGSRDGEIGYQSICVLKREVNQLARPMGTPDPQDCISASAFGREVGLRDKGRFLALVDNGHTPATQMRHPRTGVWQYFMTEGDIAAFHARFMTLTSMARKFGRHQRTYLAALQSADVTPFAPNGEDYGHLYLRQDVEPVLRHHQLID